MRRTLIPFLAATITMGAALLALAALNPPGMPWVLAAGLVPYWAACWAINRVSRPRVAIPPRPRGRGYAFPGGPTLGGHIHSGAGPCPECVATLGILAGLVGAVIEVALSPEEAAERVATTGEIRGAPMLAQVLAWTAAIDAEATSFMAAVEAQASQARHALGAPLSTVPPCGATLDRHLCRERTSGTHTHKCTCGTTWGVIL